MKTIISLLLLSLFLSLPMGAARADDEIAALTKLGAEKRAAVVRIDTINDLGVMHGYGAFISEDGLALVDLGGIALDKEPEAVAADGTPLRFGTILGIYPEFGVALIKFKHRPKVWLNIAKQEPELGEQIALVTLNGEDPLDENIPIVVGPVMAKRTDTMSNLRVSLFCRILSLGFDPTPLELRSISAGMFAIDRHGDLLAVTNGTAVRPDQAIQYLTPVVGLATRITEHAKAGDAIRHPLPKELNFTDTALMDSGYRDMDMAMRRGDRGAAQRHFRGLIEKYPDSPALKLTAATNFVDRANPTALLDDFPKPDPADPPAEQISRLKARFAILAKINADFEGAVKELQEAVALSPKDYPGPRMQLAGLYLHLRKLDEAEALLREIAPLMTDDIRFHELFRSLLIQGGKSDEAKKVAGQIAELKKVFQHRRNAAQPPPSPVGKAEEALSKLAATKRGSAIQMTQVGEEEVMNSSYGAFISEDGLALVDLEMLAKGNEPMIVAADAKLEFGIILGVFPEQNLALMKFDHHPKTWLRLAPEEPEEGEALAFITMDGEDILGGSTPPIIGQVMVKRRELSRMHRATRFTRTMAFGASISFEQLPGFGWGTFAVDRNGDLAAFSFGSSGGGGGSQLLISLAPISALSDEIDALAKAGKAIPFPLPEASNPFDPAVLDRDFMRVVAALRLGDQAAAQKLCKGLIERYPESLDIKKRAAGLSDRGNPMIQLEDWPEPDPGAPAAHQIHQLLLRANTPSPLPRAQFERAAAEMEKAVALSPQDFPLARLQLAELYVTMRRLDDAERLFREAMPYMSENIMALVQFGQVLSAQGKHNIVQILADKIPRLAAIYGLESAPPASPPTATSAIPTVPPVPSKPRKMIQQTPAASNLKPASPPAGGTVPEPPAPTAPIVPAISEAATLQWDSDVTAASAFERGADLLKAEKPESAAGAFMKAIELDPEMADAHVQLGRALGKLGKIEEAIISCRRAIQLNPNSAQGHRILSVALATQGKLEEGYQAVQAAEKLNPNDPATIQILGSFLMDFGKFEEAVATGRRAVELSPDDARSHGLLGAALGEHDKLDEAEASMRRGLEIDPDDAEMHTNLGGLLFLLEKLDEAVTALNRAIELDPEGPRANYYLGEVLGSQGKFEEAAASFRREIELQPNVAINHKRLGDSLSELGNYEEALASFQRAAEIDPTMAGAHANAGGALFSLHRFEEAIITCRRAIELDPKLGRPHGNLGAALGGQNKFAEAILSLERAIELNPNDAMAYNNLAAVYMGLGKTEEALQALKRAIELDPNEVLAHINLGKAYVTQKRFDEAATLFRRAVELAPNDANALKFLGATLAQQRKLAEAEPLLRRAVKLNPRAAMTHSSLGFTLLNLGKFEEAVAAFRRAIELDPKMAMAHNNLAAAFAWQDNPEESLAASERAIGIDPDFADAHSNRGIALSQLGRHEEAVAACRHAVELDPENVNLQGQLGLALCGLGEYEAAIAASQQGIQLDPNSASPYWAMGMALFRLEKYEEAIPAIERATELNPNFEKTNESLVRAYLITGRFEEARDSLTQSGGKAQMCSKLIRTETLLSDILKERGADDPSARLLIEEISASISTAFPPPLPTATEAYWKQHREEVAAALGTVSLRTITIDRITGDPATPQAAQQTLAREVHAKLLAGADFAEQAKAHSDDRRAKAGGLMGETKLGTLSKELETVALSLAVGEISEVIGSSTSYHILKVEAQNPGEAESFDDPGVKETAQKLLIENRRAEWAKKYVARLVVRMRSPRQ